MHAIIPFYINIQKLQLTINLRVANLKQNQIKISSFRNNNKKNKHSLGKWIGIRWTVIKSRTDVLSNFYMFFGYFYMDNWKYNWRILFASEDFWIKIMKKSSKIYSFNLKCYFSNKGSLEKSVKKGTGANHIIIFKFVTVFLLSVLYDILRLPNI